MKTRTIPYGTGTVAVILTLLLLMPAVSGRGESRTPGPEFVDVSDRDYVLLDIRYATTNNFTGKNLYGDYRRCVLHKRAADKLAKAAESLKATYPGYRFLVFDCLRPRHIQKILWDVVAGTPQASYVAHPARGSVHNFGFAIDLSLADQKGRELDMGTPYDTFSPLAEPAKEEEMLRAGRLTEEQIRNRKKLRSVMVKAGFIQLRNEWWHYDAIPASEARRGKIVE